MYTTDRNKYITGCFAVRIHIKALVQTPVTLYENTEETVKNNKNDVLKTLDINTHNGSIKSVLMHFVILLTSIFLNLFLY